jgi:hypothetical protein
MFRAVLPYCVIALAGIAADRTEPRPFGATSPKFAHRKRCRTFGRAGAAARAGASLPGSGKSQMVQGARAGYQQREIRFLESGPMDKKRRALWLNTRNADLGRMVWGTSECSAPPPGAMRSPSFPAEATGQ